MTYWTEKYQLGIVTDFLREKGIEYATEVPIYSKRIDVIGLQRNQILAIELKSQDFKQGIQQAERNSKLVDYSFLCVWSEGVTEHLIERVDKLDIGLFAVNNQVKCLSPPANNEPSPNAKAVVEDQLENEFEEEFRTDRPLPTRWRAAGD